MHTRSHYVVFLWSSGQNLPHAVVLAFVLPPGISNGPINAGDNICDDTELVWTMVLASQFFSRRANFDGSDEIEIALAVGLRGDWVWSYASLDVLDHLSRPVHDFCTVVMVNGGDA